MWLPSSRAFIRGCFSSARARGLDQQVGVSEIEFALEPLAQFGRRSHIGLGGDGQLRGVAQTLMHPLRDGLAHPAQRNAV